MTVRDARPGWQRQGALLRSRTRRTFWLIVLGLTSPAASNANPALDEAFTSYYDAMDGFRLEDLDRELSATIDDALSDGSHLSRPSTAYKRRQIADGLLRRARRTLCANVQSTPPVVRDACITGTQNAVEEAGARFSADYVGMVAAVCARLMESQPPNKRCAAP